MKKNLAKHTSSFPLLGPLLAFLCAFCIVPVTLMSLSYPPTVVSQGLAHRIFYLHVPIAWVALYAPKICAICALLYLYTRKEVYDIWSLACARVAYVFSLAVLISGPLWGSTEWGSYWNWKDARLVSFFILFLILNAYFLSRGQTNNPHLEKISSAVIAILAALATVLTWYAIRWIKPDTHPTPVLDKMSPPVAFSFWLSVLAYHLLFWLLLVLSLRQERLSRMRNELLTLSA